MRALLIIDIQNGLSQNKTLFNETLFFDTVNGAIRKFREKGDLIIYIQHCSKLLQEGSVEWEIDGRLEKRTEKDLHLLKEHGNAFLDSDLERMLYKRNINQVLICGLVSHGCVKSTCKGALKAEFDTCLLINGHSNWLENAKNLIEATENELKQLNVKLIDLSEL